MKLSKLNAGLIFIVIVIIGVLLWMRFGPKIIESGPCGEPPQAIITSNFDIDAALLSSVAAIKGRQSVQVTTLIPESARSAEAVNYLTCLAKTRGLVTTPVEIQKHKELLGFIMTNPTTEEYAKFIKSQSGQIEDPLPFKHEGLFKSIRLHFENRVPYNVFELVLPQPPPEELDRFWTGEINESSWSGFFAKLCSRHRACLECIPSANEITTRVEIRLIGNLIEETSREGTRIYKCAGSQAY